MTEYKVLCAGEQVGTAETQREGLFLTLRCSCMLFPRVMRLYGAGEEGYFPVGIPVPVGERLRLTKKYTGNDLKALPMEGVTHFELFGAEEVPQMPAAEAAPEPEPTEEAAEIQTKDSLTAEPDTQAEDDEDREREAECSASVPETAEEASESPWRRVEDASALFEDPELSETVAAIEDGLVAEDGDSLLFAIPISAKTPFPTMPVFRYGWSAMVDGKFCIVFRIKDGRLI